MGYQHFIVSICCTLFALQTLAAPKEKPTNYYLAHATANAVNSFKTVDDYVNWLGQRAPAEDVTQLKEYMKKTGIPLTEKFPKMHFEKDKVYFDKHNYMIYGKNQITINGKVFRPGKKHLIESLMDVCSKIPCGQNTAQFSLFPQAHAISGAWLGGLLGAVGLGYLGNLFAPKLGLSRTEGTWVGAAIGAGLGYGLGKHFLTRENQEACGGNCQVTCDGPTYMIDRPTSAGPTDYYDNNSTRHRIPMNCMQQTYSTPTQSVPPCNQAPQQYLTDLQYDLNNPNANYTQAQPTYPTPVNYQPSTDLQNDISGRTRIMNSVDPKKK